MENKPKKCLECGKELETNSHRYRYCSNRCFKKARKKYFRDYKREEIRELWLKVQKEIGITCVICNSPKDVCYHETNGKEHPRGRENQYLKHYLENKASFVPICRKHHWIVHTLANIRITSSENEKILNLVSKILANRTD